MKKMINIIFLILILLLLALLIYFFVGKAPAPENILWGVNFSQKHAENLGLDWEKTYLALFDDLGAKNIKLITHWDWIEGKRDEFYSNDVDWQIKEAENHDVKLIVVVGMKTGRWPECHIPEWAKKLGKQEFQEKILEYLKNFVLRYRGSKAIIAWQVENEPLFPFGECPAADKNLLRKEVELVKSLDPKRPIIVSDSGEFSLWFQAAKIGDIVGVTMYRKVYSWWSYKVGIYFHSIFSPTYYWRKSQLIKKFFGKKVICVELQAEPWGSDELLYNVPLEEQKKTMDLNQFKKNIEFAKKTGLDTFYLWGAEWWYWMKEKQGSSVIWNKAKQLFQNH